jgi:Ca2+-binding EF-hand superfamily protein
MQTVSQSSLLFIKHLSFLDTDKRSQSMKKLILLVAITFASMALNAEEDLVAKLDSDNDGRIRIGEAAEDASLSAMFTELDTNKDGYLSPNELQNK